MVVTDPAAELVALVRAMGDLAPCEPSSASRAPALLIRRRFGLALPPPFIVADPSAPIRSARPEDAAAIAAVKWRVFGSDYRGMLPDEFLDARDIVPPVSYWRDRAAGSASGSVAGVAARFTRGTGAGVGGPADGAASDSSGRGGSGVVDDRWGLLVWGGPGAVQGYLEWGPADDAGRAADTRPGEIFEIYVDPCARGAGGGGRLLDEAVGEMRIAGFARAELSVLEQNRAAQEFYRARGWETSSEPVLVDLGIVRFHERRLHRRL